VGLSQGFNAISSGRIIVAFFAVILGPTEHRANMEGRLRNNETVLLVFAVAISATQCNLFVKGIAGKLLLFAAMFREWAVVRVQRVSFSVYCARKMQ
jgi:hypothetical protein